MRRAADPMLNRRTAYNLDDRSLFVDLQNHLRRMSWHDTDRPGGLLLLELFLLSARFAK